MPTQTRANEIMERHRAAAKAAKSTGRTPVNAPSRVEPAVSRSAVKPLKPKQAAPEIEDFDEEDDEGDSPPPVRVKKLKKSKTVEPAPTPDRSSARAAARALTVLNKPQPGALAIPRNDKTRQLDSRDTLIPRLKISQAMSKVNTDDVVRQGNFYRSPDNKNLGKEIFVIMLDMRKSRSYFEQGTGVLCRSYDMIKGEGDPGLDCEGTEEEQQFAAESERGCPLRLWGERDEDGRSTPPACGVNYNYILLLLDPDDLSGGRTSQAIWTLRSTATKMARAINTMCMDNGNWTDTVLKVGIQSATNRRGTYFVPAVEYWGQSSGAVKVNAERLAERLSGTSIRASVEADSDD